MIPPSPSFEQGIASILSIFKNHILINSTESEMFLISAESPEYIVQGYIPKSVDELCKLIHSKLVSDLNEKMNIPSISFHKTPKNQIC